MNKKAQISNLRETKGEVRRTMTKRDYASGPNNPLAKWYASRRESLAVAEELAAKSKEKKTEPPQSSN